MTLSRLNQLSSKAHRSYFQGRFTHYDNNESILSIEIQHNHCNKEINNLNIHVVNKILISNTSL